MSPKIVSCPLCSEVFSASEIEQHASDCTGVPSATQNEEPFPGLEEDLDEPHPSQRRKAQLMLKKKSARAQLSSNFSRSKIEEVEAFSDENSEENKPLRRTAAKGKAGVLVTSGGMYKAASR